MSTPFADDSLLPRAVPEMPVSPHGPGTILRSERADWERRAAAANSAASQLAEAARSLDPAARANWFGDCVEGRSFHEALKGSLERLSETLTEQVNRTISLSEQCRLAADRIEGVDNEGAVGLGA